MLAALVSPQVGLSMTKTSGLHLQGKSVSISLNVDTESDTMASQQLQMCELPEGKVHLTGADSTKHHGILWCQSSAVNSLRHKVTYSPPPHVLSVHRLAQNLSELSTLLL